mmetsp:Transcript_6803/g.16970  ORF Transcript_6803/g.16970 Transcript_6803/m.16970 type:complete len:123 (+) Transcript_6803:389-757(+)
MPPKLFLCALRAGKGRAQPICHVQRLQKQAGRQAGTCVGSWVLVRPRALACLMPPLPQCTHITTKLRASRRYHAACAAAAHFNKTVPPAGQPWQQGAPACLRAGRPAFAGYPPMACAAYTTH